MQKDFRIRKAINDDLLPSFEIRKNAMMQYIVDAKGWDEEAEMQQHIEDFDTDVMQMIIADGKPIGVLETVSGAGILEVHGIYIIDEYQNFKIGSRIMAGLMRKDSSKKNKIILQVLKANNRAKDFYLRLGFTILREEELYYKMIYKPVE